MVQPVCSSNLAQISVSTSSNDLHSGTVKKTRTVFSLPSKKSAIPSSDILQWLDILIHDAMMVGVDQDLKSQLNLIVCYKLAQGERQFFFASHDLF